MKPFLCEWFAHSVKSGKKSGIQKIVLKTIRDATFEQITFSFSWFIFTEDVIERTVEKKHVYKQLKNAHL